MSYYHTEKWNSGSCLLFVILQEELGIKHRAPPRSPSCCITQYFPENMSDFSESISIHTWCFIHVVVTSQPKVASVTQTGLACCLRIFHHSYPKNMFWYHANFLICIRTRPWTVTLLCVRWHGGIHQLWSLPSLFYLHSVLPTVLLLGCS